VIPDNSPIYKSKTFKAKINEWKEKYLLIYFLPTYSQELNLIEILWRRIKYNRFSFDVNLCFQNLKERLSYVLNNFAKLRYYIFTIAYYSVHTKTSAGFSIFSPTNILAVSEIFIS
jgi:transposase